MGNESLVNTIKRMIENKRTQGLAAKLDVFLLGDRITIDEYNELTALLNKGGGN